MHTRVQHHIPALAIHLTAPLVAIVAMSDSDGRENHFTHLLIGTYYSQSILSAALATDPANEVLHIDTNDYYGSEHASLTLCQLVDKLKEDPQGNFSFPYFNEDPKTIPPELSSLDRHYSLSLLPCLQPASRESPSLQVLIRSHVAKYATFRLLQRTCLYSSENEELQSVPSSKEDIFKSTLLSLIDKRKLMKFLQAVIDPDHTMTDEELDKPLIGYLSQSYKLSSDLINAIVYGIALSPDASLSTREGITRIQSHLKSIGQYGNSAYLVTQYGGIGDLIQGYCRVSAVKGSVFVLGKDIRSITRQDERYEIKLEDIEETFTADTIIAPQDTLSNHNLFEPTPQPEPQRTLQSLLLLDRSLSIPTQSQDQDPIETALLIFPPNTLIPHHSHTITTLLLGEGTFCCPKGQYLVHSSTSFAPDGSSSAEEVHTAIKERILKLAKGQIVEWQPSSSDTKQDDTAVPLLEAHWVSAPSSPATIVPSDTATPAAQPELEGTISTLSDIETLKAEKIYYALKGIHSPPYPQAKPQGRTEDEYRGRGGVGPDDNHENDDEQPGDDGMVLFFPPEQSSNDDEE
ncbi:unnamed protein product [Sympodiomycopsis kandeliae]